jgi:hypothetical protein
MSRMPPAVRALFALGALAALLFAPVLFAGRIFYARDIHLWFWGQAETFVRCLAAGSWPVWDPYLAFGHPLWANPGTQVLYPVTWAHLLVRPAMFYTLYVVAHFLFAGVGTYLLGRRIGLGFPAALGAAAFWTSSGPFLSFASLWQHYAGIAWMPWVLLAGELVWSEPSATRALAWGSAAAGQALAGSVDSCVMTAVVSAAWLLPRALPCRWPQFGRRLAATAGALAWSVALTAALWMPAVELLRRLRRAAMSPAAVAEWSLHPAGLGQLWLPLLPHQFPLRPEVRNALFDGRGEPLLGSLYLGLSLLPLIPAAFAARWRRAALILAGIGGGALLVALGHHTPLLIALLEIPLARMLRYPSKAVVLAAYAWALLAGLGLDTWLRGDGRRRGPALVAGAVGSTFAAILGAFVLLRPHAVAAAVLAPGVDGPTVLAPVAASALFAALLGGSATALAISGARVAPFAVAGLAVLDLAVAQRALNPTAPADVLTRPPMTLGAIERGPTTRVFAFSYEVRRADRAFRRPPLTDAFEVTAGRHPDPAVARALGLQMYLHSSVASRWGLASGYQADALGISPRELLDLDLLLLDSEETPSFLRMLRLGAIDYVMALHREGLEDLELVGAFPSPFARPIHVYRVPDPLPRVFAVGTARVLTGGAARAALLDPAFDPSREVVLSDGAPVTGCCAQSRLIVYAPDRIRADVDTTVPAYLVVVDAWAPGWRARVDGSPAPVLHANVGFRAVPVPPGRHRVELRYRPRSIRDGLIVSGLAILGALAVVLRSSGRKPQR